MPQYQSFDGLKSGSNSTEKLAKLRLERLGSLAGKSVLDLGCNEGFFCEVALKLGATRVLGVDRSPVLVTKARQRAPDAEFLAATWWDIPQEQFDVIFFLSAVHYEHDQKRLFDKLLGHLKPGGTLVLECGLASDRHGVESWMQIYRGTDPTPRRYPTLEYLSDYLMPDYAVTGVGQSVTQKGDPVARWVLHCQRRRPIVILAAGGSGDGKTIMARTARREGVPVYRTDALFKRLMDVSFYDRTQLAQALRQAEGKGVVTRASKAIQESPELLEAFVGVVCDEAPLEAPLSIIEGEILQRDRVAEAMVRALEARGAVVWTAERARAEARDAPALNFRSVRLAFGA